MAATGITSERVWQALDEVSDPEIPVISLVELGVIREASVDEAGAVTVQMTPTFSGCPALAVMEQDIKEKLAEEGATAVTVETVLHPPWSSDEISEAGRRKLKEFGLAPPGRHGGDVSVTFFEPVACPYCDSTNTTVKNTFGSTLCRAIHYCNDCRQPFEQFKPL
jgi:ring-1,2-phenylacetyl-CoA epoxidase subunit PaaD